MQDLVSISSDNLLVNRLTEHQRLHLSQRRFEDHSIRSIIPDLWQRPSLSRPNDMTFEPPRKNIGHFSLHVTRMTGPLLRI
jgi:hypothetical protein